MAGDSHKHVVEPYGVLVRTLAGKSAVAEPELLLHDILCIVGYYRSGIDGWCGSCLAVCPDGKLALYHCRADGTGVIKGMRVGNLPHLLVNLSPALYILHSLWEGIGYRLELFLYIFSISAVAGSLGGCQAGTVGHAPFVARGAELLRVCKDITQHPVNTCLHLLLGRYTIFMLIVWCQQVEWGV